MNTDAHIIEMRLDERLDANSLEQYLASRLPQTAGTLRIQQFATGAANLTYLLRYDDAEYVLRRPPLGPIAPGSHDMQRESHILSSLFKEFPLAPQAYFFDPGEEVVGAPFFVMERRHGFVINKVLPESIRSDDDQKSRLAWMLIDTLAELHRLDPSSVGLDKLGHPDGYAMRQLQGWTKRWVNAEGERYDGAKEIIAMLTQKLPKPRRTALIHNDYKLNNVIVDHHDPCLATAVVDWDMCTRGDPLFDLGLLLVYWSEPNDDPLWVEAASMPAFSEGGFPSRADAVNRYANKVDSGLDEIDWHMNFGIFKLMTILQQIYIRYQRGQTRDQRFAFYDDRIRALIDQANHRIAGDVRI